MQCYSLRPGKFFTLLVFASTTNRIFYFRCLEQESTPPRVSSDSNFLISVLLQSFSIKIFGYARSKLQEICVCRHGIFVLRTGTTFHVCQFPFQAPSKLASLSLYSTTYSLSVNNNLVDCRWLGPDWGGFIHSGG